MDQLPGKTQHCVYEYQIKSGDSSGHPEWIELKSQLKPQVFNNTELFHIPDTQNQFAFVLHGKHGLQEIVQHAG